jgi:hypothetical protein
MGWPLTVTLGRQEIVIGDGFLIGDGTYDRVAQWSAPLKSFDAARAAFDLAPFKVDLFAAYVDKDWVQYRGFHKGRFQDQLPAFEEIGGSRLYGTDLTWTGEAWGTWGLSAFFRNDQSLLDNDTIAVSLRGAAEIPFLSGLKLEGEVVREMGHTRVKEADIVTGGELARRSWGGHIDLTYTFNMSRFKPHLGASYIYLPGDDPDTPGTNEAFDPLFYGYTDWGKWSIGNIVGGGGQLVNSNERVIKLEAGLIPSASTQLRLLYYHFDLDRGVGLDFSKRHYADETELVFDYWPNSIFYAGVELGYAHPLEAARYWNADPATGKDATRDIWELIMWTGLQF